MKKSVKTIMAIVAVVALVATLSVCFAACGDETGEPLPAAGSVITIGYTIAPPMNFKDAEGNLTGFDTELATKVFTNLGYKTNFKEINWENKYTDLKSKNIDCVWNGFTFNCADDDGVQRTDKIDFSYAYMTNSQAIVVQKGSALASATDFNTSFKGKLGRFENGSAAAGMMDTFKGATNKGVLKQIDALMEVKSEPEKFAVVDIVVANENCGKGDYANLMVLTNLSKQLDAEKYAIGFRKGAALKDAVNKELVKLSNDGTIATLAAKYGLEDKIISNIGA